MEPKSTAIIKCRGIILDKDNLLVVKHKSTGFYALPGGHLEWPESPIECLVRELEEEFGIKPEVGKLLYVNCYQYKYDSYQYGYDNNFVEFFFEVKNGKEYLDTGKFNGKDKDELLDILWVDKKTSLKILPDKFLQDFKEGKIFSSEVQFIK